MGLIRVFYSKWDDGAIEECWAKSIILIALLRKDCRGASVKTEMLWEDFTIIQERQCWLRTRCRGEGGDNSSDSGST